MNKPNPEPKRNAESNTEKPTPDRGENRIEPIFGDEADTGAPHTGADSHGADNKGAADKGPDSVAVAALKEELARAQASAAEHQDKFLRAKAETENIRRRAETDVANARKFGIEAFAAELLAVRDSLELAKGVDLSQGGDVTKKMIEGLDLTLKLFDAAFQKFALTVIDPAGEKFDPDRHQAMTVLETDDVPPNHVVKVVQKGYLLNNRLLRPAMVVVAKAKAAPAPGPTG